MSNYEGMSLEQLEAAISELQSQKDAVREELRTANAARDSKLAAASVEAKFASMSEAERAALRKLAQTIAPSVIESQEGVGEPGA